MSKVAVVYWSGTGNTEEMANSVAAGAKKGGADVTMFSASDFSAAKVAEFDGIAFGCPAMGAEQLEDSEFQPMWDDVKGSLSGKKIGLFGSYDWGEGDWMTFWADDAAGAGVAISETVIANNAPDAEAKAKCEALGTMLA